MLLSSAQIDRIIAIALQAGEIASHAFITKDFSVKNKIDGSRVTSADIIVSEFLRKELAELFPQIPIICEEGSLRQINEEVFFLIDPIDGTSSFIAGSKEFAINIALIKNKKAVFGLIFAPLFEGGKMVFCNGEYRVILRKLNGENKELGAIFPDSRPLRIVTSSRSKDVDVEKYVAQIYPEFLQNFTVEKLASAVKFFRLLEGDADIYVNFRRSMEWDSAAGQALVEFMGGKVKNLLSNHGEFSLGEELVYKKFNFENMPFVAEI